jgi:anti-sigma factor RsiW
MSDRRVRRRSSALERDLARLADGTLKGPRRELLGRLLDRSPELQRRLDDQRRARTAVRSAAARERAPLPLRMRYRTLTPRRSRFSLTPGRLGLGPRPRLGLRSGLGLAGSLAALAAILVVLATGPAGPTVALAATVATRPAVASVGEPREDSVRLPGVRAAGLPFPYWEDRFGWRATGARTDRIDGRALTTVFYRNGAERVAYTIVSGRPLAPGTSSVRTLTRARTELGILSTTSGRHIVTWTRRGHTCVLSGRGVPLKALLELAAWRADGQIPY